MYNVSKAETEYDIYDFIDDGINKSIYTILNGYHPVLNKDFSLANLINCMTQLGLQPGQLRVYTINYEKEVEKFINLLQAKTNTSTLFEDSSDKVSDEEFNRIFDELKETCADNPDCQFFVTIKDYLEYAKKTMSKPEQKPLRDKIVSNAVQFLSSEEIDSAKVFLLKTVYLPTAEDKVRAVNHKDRQFGKYPEWDKLQTIKKIIHRRNGLKEYDEYYEEATEHIKAEALKAMQKAKVSTVCELKRRKFVTAEIKPSIVAETRNPNSSSIPEMFDKLKREPQKNENAWNYESYKKPELICDIEAQYSENGIENQRVIAFRHGKLKYRNTAEKDGVYIDNTAGMPELIGITRLGKDGTKTYFVLMQPLDKMTFRPIGEKPEDPGEKPYGFTITQDVEVPTRFGGTKTERQSSVAQIVDGKTKEKLNAFLNRDIPENLKDFFVKVYFSDEFLSNAIRNNARYIGTVLETDDGPRIRASDVGKSDLAAAYYAKYHPGTINGLKAKSFESYCSSTELDIMQYNLISEYERNKARQQSSSKTKKDEGAR